MTALGVIDDGISVTTVPQEAELVTVSAIRGITRDSARTQGRIWIGNVLKPVFLSKVL
jgi:hypothetical protein